MLLRCAGNAPEAPTCFLTRSPCFFPTPLFYSSDEPRVVGFPFPGAAGGAGPALLVGLCVWTGSSGCARGLRASRCSGRAAPWGTNPGAALSLRSEFSLQAVNFVSFISERGLLSFLGREAALLEERKGCVVGAAVSSGAVGASRVPQPPARGARWGRGSCRTEASSGAVVGVWRGRSGERW